MSKVQVKNGEWDACLFVLKRFPFSKRIASVFSNKDKLVVKVEPYLPKRTKSFIVVHSNLLHDYKNKAYPPSIPPNAPRWNSPIRDLLNQILE